MPKRNFIIPVAFLLCTLATNAQHRSLRNVRVLAVDSGWAGNSVNTVIFRKNSIASFGNTQFIAYYNTQGNVVLGKRKLWEAQWELHVTDLKGNIGDAHNSISIMADGHGYLHLSWDHHNSKLNYCTSKVPLSLEMGDKRPMTGMQEESVSYPEFYRLPDGNLLFFYRDGASGKGNVVVNRYDALTRQWTRLHTNLIDGEGERNAYWQACVDITGVIHLSWVWRESPDVASNHDLCYARSTDGGITWENASGEKYKLPINVPSAEYAWRIPQRSELINQTSMCTDSKGMPVIAGYWRDSGSVVPQYRIVSRVNGRWNLESLSFRKTAFSLSGEGTRRIPVSRPQVICWTRGKRDNCALFFRDEERGNRVSVAWRKKGKWKVHDLFPENTGEWEPTYDTELWKSDHSINLFVQKVTQEQAEGVADTRPEMIRVLEWTPY